MRFDIPNPAEFSNLSRGTYISAIEIGTWKKQEARYDNEKVEINVMDLDEEGLVCFMVRAKITEFIKQGERSLTRINGVKWLKFAPSPIWNEDEGVREVTDTSVENFMKKLSLLSVQLEVDILRCKKSETIAARFNESRMSAGLNSGLRLK